MNKLRLLVFGMYSFLVNRKKIATSLILLAFIFIVVACKKKNAFNAEDGQDLVDITAIRAHTDLVMVDANEAISSYFFLRGKPAGNSGAQSGTGISSCALKIDSSNIYNGVVILNYTGAICNNLKREGQVLVTIQNYPLKKWKDKGAMLKLEFVNYQVTNVVDGKVLKITGLLFVTNESGGTWYELRYLNLASVVHSISGGDLKATFDKTQNVYYNIERRITYTINGTLISASSEGTTSQNGLSNVDCWGSDRNEKNFASRIDKAVVWNTNCTSVMPVSGDFTAKVDGKYFDLLGSYGTDANGNFVNGTDCAYGWKMTWSLRNNTKTRVFSY